MSLSDSGYDSSDEWEYVDEDDNDEEDEEWEYFVETSPVEIPCKELQHPNCSTELLWRKSHRSETVARYNLHGLSKFYPQQIIRTLENWIKIMKDKSSNILECLEEEFSASSLVEGQSSQEKILKPSVKQYIGKKNKSGKYHGEGEIR